MEKKKSTTKLIRSKLERQNLDSLRHDTCHATWDQITQGTVSNKHLSKNNDGVKQRWKSMNMAGKIYKTIGNQVLSQWNRVYRVSVLVLC